ncbi:hypothetical protein bsdtb5_34330 [Anaeromicropila herbilytica]|uniref:Uncharacterized protein n=1 Tax=Anaeromicropila herbilytica TaxID=2785025 RepID=A0A7R7IFH1_9FIRM|nr:hypothetical protein bsdtb5_34330 [Anaeromicropila herbilytica]
MFFEHLDIFSPPRLIFLVYSMQRESLCYFLIGLKFEFSENDLATLSRQFEQNGNAYASLNRYKKF